MRKWWQINLDIDVSPSQQNNQQADMTLQRQARGKRRINYWLGCAGKEASRKKSKRTGPCGCELNRHQESAILLACGLHAVQDARKAFRFQQLRCSESSNYHSSFLSINVSKSLGCLSSPNIPDPAGQQFEHGLFRHLFIARTIAKTRLSTIHWVG